MKNPSEELALVLIKLQVVDKEEPHYVMMRHTRWGDLSLLGGYLEPSDWGDWAKAAKRECNEDLAPLKHRKDFLLLPIFSQPLNLPEFQVTGQIFTLRFQTDPMECLNRLPKKGYFQAVAESEATSLRDSSDDRLSMTARVVLSALGTPLSWDTPVTGINSALFSRVCAGPVHFADQGIEVCNTCGGCICCDFNDVNHIHAEYECFKSKEGRCSLKAHSGRPCKETPAPTGSREDGSWYWLNECGDYGDDVRYKTQEAAIAALARYCESV